MLPVRMVQDTCMLCYASCIEQGVGMQALMEKVCMEFKKLTKGGEMRHTSLHGVKNKINLFTYVLTINSYLN